MRLEPIFTRLDLGGSYSISLCHWCKELIDWRQGGWYQDSMGRWEYCTNCYVHVQHPAGETLAWWYAIEHGREMSTRTI